MWIIVLLGGIATFIMVVLCVPLDIVFNMDTNGRPRFTIRLLWLFGLVRKEIRKAEKKAERGKKGIKSKRRLRDRGRRVRAVITILRTKGMVKQLRRLSKETISRLQIRELGADVRVGLGGPAETGMLFAFIGPVVLFLSIFCSHRIHLQPSFGDEAVFEGHSFGTVRLRPIWLVPIFTRFAFSPATMRAAKALVLTK